MRPYDKVDERGKDRRLQELDQDAPSKQRVIYQNAARSVAFEQADEATWGR